MASGAAFAEVFRPLKDCLLSYVVPDPDRNDMHSCLSHLHRELSPGGFSLGPFSVQGLLLDGTSIAYTCGVAFATHLGMAESPTRKISVLGNIYYTDLSHQFAASDGAEIDADRPQPLVGSLAMEAAGLGIALLLSRDDVGGLFKPQETRGSRQVSGAQVGIGRRSDLAERQLRRFF